jgi:hypothetical protein
MTELQWGGACYVLAALLGLVWWRLRIEAELYERDNNQDDDDDEHKPED